MARDRSRTRKSSAGGLKDTGGDALQLVIDYVKQETLEPLKGLGRYMVFGIAGSLALAIGVVILAVALLRLLQTETGSTFAGNWSWAPYLLCLVAMVVVAGLAVVAIGRGQRRGASRPTKENR